MASPRIQRPIPHRIDPDRRFVGVLGGTDDREDPREAHGGEAERDPAAGAVHGAYSVIDDYLRQGQRLAESFWLPLTPQRGGGVELDGLAERFMRSAVDLSAAWLEMMQQWMPSPAPREAPEGAAPPFGATAAAPEPEPAATRSDPEPARGVVVEVEASRPARVSVELLRPWGGEALALGPLQPAIGAAPPLRDLAVEASARALVVRVRVPSEQPAGVYNGMLLDGESHRPRGMVSVVLAEASSASRTVP